MTERPFVDRPTSYGGLDTSSQWHEYPSGLIDLTRPATGLADAIDGPGLGAGEFELDVEGARRVRISARKATLVVLDMQNFWLLPELTDHPTALAIVPRLLELVAKFRSLGVRIIWLNWGLAPEAIRSLPPSLQRDYDEEVRSVDGSAPEVGFGAYLGPAHGRLLLQGEPNSKLYEPLQAEYEEGAAAGTDVWIDKDRMSGLWGRGTALETYLSENGIKTLFISGINADQCVMGTVVDAFSLGFDVIAVQDAIATTSPAGGFENLLFNCLEEYGFVTDTKTILRVK